MEVPAAEEAGRAAMAMDRAAVAAAEAASTSEMSERKRKLSARRSRKGLGSNRVASSLREPRPGLCQVLTMEEVAGGGAEPSVRLSPTGIAGSAVPSYQSEVCKDGEAFVMVSTEISPQHQTGLVNEAWRLPPLPAINEASLRFAESASNFGRRLANLVGKDLIEKTDAEAQNIDEKNVNSTQNRGWHLPSCGKIPGFREVLQGPLALGARLKAGLRSGSLPLSGKSSGPPPTCPVCGHGVEDTVHFLMQCSGYSFERTALFSCIRKTVTTPLFQQFDTLDAVPKAMALLAGEFWGDCAKQVDTLVSMFLETIWKARTILISKEENVTRDIRQNLIDPIAGTSAAAAAAPVSEHERIRVNPTPTSPSAAAEANGRLLDNASLLSNLSVERAASLFTSTGAAVMGMGQHFLSVPPAVWNGLVTRVQTTLRGSADDIGWLGNTPGYPAAEDGTEEFLKTLEQIGRGVHVLPNTLTYLLVPGLFSNHGPLYFFDTKKHFSKLGLPCHIAKIHSESAVEKNARELKDHIEELYRATGKKVVLLGHSKGGVDAAAACSMFWPQLRDKVVGVVLVQSPYAGSPVASDILREGQIADFETRRIMEILICKIIKGDMQSLEDLTYEKRRQFLARYSLPPDVPVISFHTEASRAPRAVSVMSHVAHAQLPWLPGAARSGAEDGLDGCEGRLHVAVPLAAAMAICALHLELRYGEKSDGLVTRKDAEVPGSIVVKPEKKLDHAWMVYAPSRREPNEPDAAQMCEALIALLLSHPRWRRQDDVPVTPESPAVLEDAASTTAENQDDADLLTTEAARSFLADPSDADAAVLEMCASEVVGRPDHGRGDSTPELQKSDAENLTTKAARRFLADADARDGPAGRAEEGEGADHGLELQRHISDMVVLETIARVLDADAVTANSVAATAAVQEKKQPSRPYERRTAADGDSSEDVVASAGGSTPWYMLPSQQ